MFKPDPKINATEQRKLRKLKEEKPAKLRSRIKARSKINTSKDSQGKSWSTDQIERKVYQAKTRKSFESNGHCEACGRNDLRIHKSHLVSVKYARENGMTELCWDLLNIEDHCEQCHDDIERLPNIDRLNIYRNKL